jgi:hypothetical protein
MLRGAVVSVVLLCAAAASAGAQHAITVTAVVPEVVSAAAPAVEVTAAGVRVLDAGRDAGRMAPAGAPGRFVERTYVSRTQPAAALPAGSAVWRQSASGFVLEWSGAGLRWRLPVSRPPVEADPGVFVVTRVIASNS